MDAKGRTSVALLAILKMDELTDRWTVIYADESAELSEENRKQIFSDLLTEMKTNLSAEELSSIARIAVFNTKEHLVQSLLRYQTGVKIQSEKINGNFVHEGYIIKAATTVAQVEKVDTSALENATEKVKASEGN